MTHSATNGSIFASWIDVIVSARLEGSRAARTGRGEGIGLERYLGLDGLLMPLSPAGVGMMRESLRPAREEGFKLATRGS